jgi:hypothetical protein
LHKAVNAVVEAIKNAARPVVNKAEIQQIATISAQDEEV